MAPVKTSKKEPEINLQFPSDIGAHGMLMVFRDYSYVPPGERGVLRYSESGTEVSSMSSVLLPIPPNLVENFELRTSRNDLNFRGDAVNRMVNQGSDAVGGGAIPGTLNSALGFDASGMWNRMRSGDWDAVKTDIVHALRVNMDNVFTRAIAANTGTAINSKAGLIFDGIELKTNTFTWQLSPRSEAESANLQKIISFIKKSALPSYGEGNELRLWLNYPKTVDLFLLGVAEDYFPLYKTGMIRSVGVNYTSQGGLALLKGGKPASVSLDLTIMEMDIHTSEDVR